MATAYAPSPQAAEPAGPLGLQSSPPLQGMNGTIREDFERDGYAVFDSGIPMEVIDRVVAELEDEFHPGNELQEKPSLVRRLLQRPPRSRFSYTDHIRIQDAWLGSQDVKAIARAPKILALLRELYGREPLPFQTLNFRVGTQQQPHADAFHFNSDPPGYMCGVWVALEDIDESSGPLVYYAGSHRLPEVSPADLLIAPTQEEYPKYEAYVQEQIEREGLEPRLGTLRKGEALVWASNLLHGGSPRADPQRTRRSQVTHYFFSDCRYWTPMLSSEEQRHWRNPTWIK
jgi:ectoine hydroxylase-related dioxygenase (phytanoyl-CoA dioxygenase family)